MTAATVEAPTNVPELDQAWIRGVLFERSIEDWVDLGPDPLRRRYVGSVYAEEVAACYQAWKWHADQTGGNVDEAPTATDLPEALALAQGASDWTELMAALLTVGRARSLLYGELVRNGDDQARRGFDRLVRESAGHAALGFLELSRGGATDPERAAEALSRMVPATRAWLASIDADLASRWVGGITPLLVALGQPTP